MHVYGTFSILGTFQFTGGWFIPIPWHSLSRRKGQLGDVQWWFGVLFLEGTPMSWRHVRAHHVTCARIHVSNLFRLSCLSSLARERYEFWRKKQRVCFGRVQSYSGRVDSSSLVEAFFFACKQNARPSSNDACSHSAIYTIYQDSTTPRSHSTLTLKREVSQGGCVGGICK